MADVNTAQMPPAPDYSVGNLYKKSWQTVKSNLWPLVLVTLISALLVTVATVITAGLLIGTFPTSIDDLDDFIVSAIAAVVLIGLVGIVAGLLQVIALKSGVENGRVEVASSVKNAFKFVPRVLAYGVFLVALMVAALVVIVILGAIAEPLAILGVLALVFLVIMAVFRYAFLQYLIVETRPMGFLERFKVSQKMTSGIYGKLALLWLVAVGLSIVGGIVSTVITSPFTEESTTSIKVNFDGIDENASTEDQLNSAFAAFNDALDETRENNTLDITPGYVVAQIISQTITWGVSLVVLGAALHLYNQRSKDVLNVKAGVKPVTDNQPSVA